MESMQVQWTKRVGLLLLALTCLPSCTLLDSASESVSQIVGSASDLVASPSAMAEPDETFESYYRDIQAYASSAALLAEDERELMLQIADIASRHGISHWESYGETWVAIGSGLGESEGDDVEIFALLDKVSAIDSIGATLTRTAYEETRSR